MKRNDNVVIIIENWTETYRLLFNMKKSVIIAVCDKKGDNE